MSFKIGDRVVLVRDGFAMSADIGAEAIIVKFDGDYIYLEWDKTDSRHNEQEDGGYFPQDFKLAVRSRYVSNEYFRMRQLEEESD